MKKAAKPILFSVVLVLVAFGVAWATCSVYDNTRIRVSQGEVYCGSTGPGCTECDEYNQGGYNGSCYMMASGSLVCTDGSGHIYYAN